MRRIQRSFGIFCLLAVALGAPTAAVAQGHGACAQIRAACQSAGFVQGAANLGIGLQVDCVAPIVRGTAQRPRARKPLPQVDPQLIAQCANSHPRFGRPNVLGAELQPLGVNPPPPGSPYLSDSPSRDYGKDTRVPPPVVGGGLRPPTQSGAEERSIISALPPEDQPETGPTKSLPQFRRTEVSYPTKEAAGTIVVDTPNTYLYLVLGNGKAMRYGIGVGREGFIWSGVQTIARKAEWPDWIPPAKMLQRQPYLPRFMAGGPGNPLGARAMYLGGTIYRIHGTNQPSTIGGQVSSGCIRMVNDDVIDLYGRVNVGAKVVVLPAERSADAYGRGRPGSAVAVAANRASIPSLH
jgi:lipoprotein-anchoring transpeptidase ErfK/SrfK